MTTRPAIAALAGAILTAAALVVSQSDAITPRWQDAYYGPWMDCGAPGDVLAMVLPGVVPPGSGASGLSCGVELISGNGTDGPSAGDVTLGTLPECYLIWGVGTLEGGTFAARWTHPEDAWQPDTGCKVRAVWRPAS